jgi:2-methylcitrate dehydratase
MTITEPAFNADLPRRSPDELRLCENRFDLGPFPQACCAGKVNREHDTLHGRNVTGTIQKLATILCATRVERFSGAAIEQAQLLLLDTIGCGIAGAHEASSSAVVEAVLRAGRCENCVLMGRKERASSLDAVLINGVAIRVLDLNDYLIRPSNAQPETAGHPSDNIPVALAMGAARGQSGRAILTSIVIGYELYARLQSLMDRGGPWDGVTVSGVVAPAIAGWLMGLDEDRLAHALALGAARSATPAIVRTGHISSAKSMANALVAQSGVQAVLLAETGATGPLAILDDARGLRGIFDRERLAVLAEPIGDDSAILRAHVKAYPCINTGQSAVAAALELHAMLEGHTEELDRVEIVMADYPVIRRQQEDEGRARPQSREAADHSFPFLVAVTLIDGVFGVEQFERERWHDSRVTALMQKITMRRDAAWNTRAPGGFPCALYAYDRQGRRFAADVAYPPGFSQNGIGQNAVIEKFHAVTAPHLGRSTRERIVDAVMDFAHSRSTTALDCAIGMEGTTS